MAAIDPSQYGNIDPVTGNVKTGVAGQKLNGNLASDLLGQISGAVNAYGTQQAQQLAAAGYSSEAGSYNSAAAVARQNEVLARASGDVQEAQIGLQVKRTIGSQQASIAAAGFGSGGTALSLMRSSQRQGIIEQQLVGVNSEVQQNSFEQQALAADAESQAANASAAQAGSLAATAGTVAGALKTNATSIAAGLGLNIPGLSNLSATSMPAAAGTLGQAMVGGASGNGTGMVMMGGKMVSPQNPYVI